ncbi:hypothetical protein [Emticicia fontis]
MNKRTSLFRFDDIKAKPEENNNAITEAFELDSATPDGIAAIVSLLHESNLVSFITEGKWSVHQLIVKVFQEYGKGQLSFCTWGLSEPPLRAIHTLKQVGLITRLEAVLDWRIRERQPNAYQYFEGMADAYGFAKSHAKGYMIATKTEKFTILITANLNRNTKNEFGCIMRSENTYNLYHTWIQKHLQQKNETK